LVDRRWLLTLIVSKEPFDGFFEQLCRRNILIICSRHSQSPFPRFSR
jgi:hypothetical protein